MTFKVVFEHIDGTINTFLSTPNPFSSSQMYTFDNWVSCYASNLRNVKSIVKNIEKYAKIITKEITNNKEEEKIWPRKI